MTYRKNTQFYHMKWGDSAIHEKVEPNDCSSDLALLNDRELACS